MRGATATIILLAIGCGALADETQREYERFQGQWRVVRLEENGEAEPDDELRRFRLTIRGRSIMVDLEGQRQTTEFRIDPTQQPKQITLIPHYGEDKGKTFHGIYDIQGNHLRICATRLPDRPKVFESRRGLLLLVLERQGD